MELDAAFPSLCAAAQGNHQRPWPTFSLALASLAEAHWSALTPAAPLRRWRLIEVGALLTYGPNTPELFRRAAGYVDKILKGARPTDLPMQQPTTFELNVNFKAAQRLGITIPPTVIARADKTFE